MLIVLIMLHFRTLLALRRGLRPLAVSATAIIVAAGAAGCSSSDSDSAGEAAPKGDCPTAPVQVVVSVDQWGDIVEQLGGDCAEVTTIIKSSSADPHDYEPTPADAAEFEVADLVVVNGLDYDPWADKAVDTLDPAPAVVDGGDVVGLSEGDDPHIWYGPEYVTQVAAAVTAELQKLSPDATDHFAEQQTAWQSSMQPYTDEIAAIAAVSAGTTYGATESVFDYMAVAVGLEDTTPQGYENAAANESEPAPADVLGFQTALEDSKMSVLIFNTQTEGPAPEQIRTTAESADVPVVEVTETVPPGTDSFVEWQVTQLRALAAALGA